MRILALDTDTHAGFAVIDTSAKTITTQYYATKTILIGGKKRNRLDVAQTASIFKNVPSPDVVVYEQQAGLPNQSSVSTFTFGEVYGQLQGLCYAIYPSAEPVYVRPAQWKNALQLTAVKETNLTLAKVLFKKMPKELDKVANVSVVEAVLLAFYYAVTFKVKHDWTKYTWTHVDG